MWLSLSQVQGQVARQGGTLQYTKAAQPQSSQNPTPRPKQGPQQGSRASVGKAGPSGPSHVQPTQFPTAPAHASRKHASSPVSHAIPPTGTIGMVQNPNNIRPLGSQAIVQSDSARAGPPSNTRRESTTPNYAFSAAVNTVRHHDQQQQQQQQQQRHLSNHKMLAGSQAATDHGQSNVIAASTAGQHQRSAATGVYTISRQGREAGCLPGAHVSHAGYREGQYCHTGLGVSQHQQHAISRNSGVSSCASKQTISSPGQTQMVSSALGSRSLSPASGWSSPQSGSSSPSSNRSGALADSLACHV